MFPPEALWSPVSAEAVAADWRRPWRRVRPADPVGLFVLFPERLERVLALGRVRGVHPYLECLKREADLLGLPAALPYASLFVGGGGAGFAGLTAKDVDDFFRFLGGRFRLAGVKQYTVEIRGECLDKTGVRALVRNGIDRVSAILPAGRDAEKRAAFLRGMRLCRESGISRIHVDIPFGADPEGEVGRVLGADSLSVRTARRIIDSSQGRTSALRGRRGERFDVNRQLADSFSRNASIVALGWGAKAHLRGRLVYGGTGSLAGYAKALLSGKSPRYAGMHIGIEDEMRAHIIRAIEDVGRLDLDDFRRLFGQAPEEIFPREFASLRKRGRLLDEDGRVSIISASGGERLLCSAPFYGSRTLRALGLVKQ